MAALAASASQASSHREAPNITRMPAVDATDFYMFNSYEPGRKNYVTILADYVPLQDAYGGPNYFALDEDALYEILIDNDGDAREDLTFQFRFTNRLGNGDQGLALNVGGTSVAVPLKNIGPVSAQDRSLLNFTESYTLQGRARRPPQRRVGRRVARRGRRQVVPQALRLRRDQDLRQRRSVRGLRAFATSTTSRSRAAARRAASSSASATNPSP